MSFTQSLAAAFPPGMWILAVVAAAACAEGFWKYIYFLSVGYGLAVASLGIAMIPLSTGRADAGGIVCMLLLAAYGIRLSSYLVVREVRSGAYRRNIMQKVVGPEKILPFFVKIIIWLFCTLLYVAQVSPVYYRFINGVSGGGAVWTGAAVMVAGLLTEGLADVQKSIWKKRVPGMVVTHGLYRFVRCPNYFGEIVFWTGVLVSGVFSMQGIVQRVVALFGYVCIVTIMIDGALRLEKRQEKQYGKDPVYRKYADGTPIIIPFVPLYHLVKRPI